MLQLTDKVTNLAKVGPFYAKKLEKLGIHTIEDLFYHVPSRYMDYSNLSKINSLRAGDVVTIHAKINSLTNIISKRGVRMQIGTVEDESGKITVLWFNQPFLIRMLYPGKLVSLSGKVGFFNRKICLTAPDYEILDDSESDTVHTGRLVAVYPETSGLSSKWLRTLIKKNIENGEIDFSDLLPPEILEKFNLQGIKDAIRRVHLPDNLDEVSPGKKRLAFNELMLLQLKGEYRKLNWQKNKVTNKLNVDKKSLSDFIDSLPFTLTDSQKKVVNELTADLDKNIPMNRLLEGDVGSGKTVVAAIGAFVAFANGYQSLIMAPTQILAQQHYETLIKLFKKFNLRISLVTSAIKKMELGRNDIIIGTHSLIHSKIDFKNVAFIVIDEQHRFGVEQRRILVDKTGIPHVLTMTATPIPRTIALTSYGDLDLSILSESPKGRQKITTWVVPEEKRKGAYAWINTQITGHGTQCFIVCPLIEDSETETLNDVKSVTSEFVKLKKIFSGLKIGLLHGRLKALEKEKVLLDFKNHKTDILVTTPVVEVGIDIPNATIMVIEAAERFGLAQLHQLRGRVGRGKEKSHCLLFSNFHSGSAFSRLKAMEKSHSGFELAELDLKLRGPGEIFGTVQSGFPGLKVADWTDIDLIKKSKEFASEVITNQNKFPKIIKRLYSSPF